METAVALFTTAAMLAASHAFAAEAQKPQRLYWPHLALSKDRGERIDSFEIQVTCGEFRGVSNIPKDWSLEVVSPSSGITHLRASAGHGAAMIWSLREMQGSIHIGEIDPSCFNISAQIVVDSSGQAKTYKFNRAELRLRP